MSQYCFTDEPGDVLFAPPRRAGFKYDIELQFAEHFPQLFRPMFDQDKPSPVSVPDGFPTEPVTVVIPPGTAFMPQGTFQPFGPLFPTVDDQAEGAPVDTIIMRPQEMPVPSPAMRPLPERPVELLLPAAAVPIQVPILRDEEDLRIAEGDRMEPRTLEETLTQVPRLVEPVAPAAPAQQERRLAMQGAHLAQIEEGGLPVTAMEAKGILEMIFGSVGVFQQFIKRGERVGSKASDRSALKRAERVFNPCIEEVNILLQRRGGLGALISRLQAAEKGPGTNLMPEEVRALTQLANCAEELMKERAKEEQQEVVIGIGVPAVLTVLGLFL